MGRDLVARSRELTAAINGLGREIAVRTKALAPALLALPGCGPLAAAQIVGETAGITRFRSRAAFANHTGTAPIPVSGRATPSATASTGVATVSSTPPFTGSRLPNSSTLDRAATTWQAGSLSATRSSRRSALFVVASAMRSSDGSALTRQVELP